MGLVVVVVAVAQLDLGIVDHYYYFVVVIAVVVVEPVVVDIAQLVVVDVVEFEDVVFPIVRNVAGVGGISSVVGRLVDTSHRTVAFVVVAILETGPDIVVVVDAVVVVGLGINRHCGFVHEEFVVVAIGLGGSGHHTHPRVD